MKKVLLIVGMFFLLSIPASSYAIGIEAAAGAWNQSPSGEFGYNAVTSNDLIDVESDLGFNDETKVMGRVKIDMPLLIPNIYLMATPMEFDGEGSKNIAFEFGDETFNADFAINSKITLDHYDIALYYGIPFTGLATLGKLNIDLGANLRFIDIEASLEQPDLGKEDSGSTTALIPMLFAAVQVGPISRVTLEAEARGISYSGNSFISLIGRVKVNVFGPLYAAGGYRSEKVNIDEEDVEVDVTIDGPFVEAGFQF